LLNRRADVAAYGCVDEIGSKMVLEKVRKLSVYDPDPARIGELSQKLFDPWKFNACVHDILEKPLPAAHEAIYNLDTLEYVSPSDEDRYLQNLSHSLCRSRDILIIGVAPCAADDDIGIDAPVGTGLCLGIADERLRDGPLRYRRTGAAVKALLEFHFRTVTLFSMTAGVLQAGAEDTGDYLFALCSSKRR
jgi:hypothetical protein